MGIAIWLVLLYLVNETLFHPRMIYDRLPAANALLSLEQFLAERPEHLFELTYDNCIICRDQP